MYAVIQVGSSQFKVSEGDVIETLLLKEEIGKEVALEKVLMIDDGKDVQVGQPFVDGATVTAKVVKHCLGEKVVAFKYRRRKDSSSKIGHRAKLTALNITKIKV